MPPCSGDSLVPWGAVEPTGALHFGHVADWTMTLPVLVCAAAAEDGLATLSAAAAFDADGALEGDEDEEAQLAGGAASGQVRACICCAPRLHGGA